MIRNLNQVSFQGFGTILPERAHTAKIVDKSARQTIPLQAGDAPVYRAVSEAWLNCGTGMSVLSVSNDGEEYYHFYLDKPVCVKNGVIFSVTPFLGDATYEMAASTWPEVVGVKNVESLRVEHRMRVEGLYTFFYHEKEQGFFFPGQGGGAFCQQVFLFAQAAGGGVPGLAGGFQRFAQGFQLFFQLALLLGQGLHPGLGLCFAVKIQPPADLLPGGGGGQAEGVLFFGAAAVGLQGGGQALQLFACLRHFGGAGLPPVFSGFGGF